MIKLANARLWTMLLALVVGLVASSSARASATITIQNNDGANTGFNDPTPVAPVGGNSGTTVGQQRLNAFMFAASIWGATINSGPTITISASWAALTCDANKGVLGEAGSTAIRRDFPNAPFAGTWYSVPLANAISGTDLNSDAEISAQFNSNVGTTGCLKNSFWYYGLDGNHGNGGIDLVTVLLHEFAHGLGFSTFTSGSTGAQIGGLPSVYDQFLRDNTTGKLWVNMTNAERVASAINTGSLVWNGPQVIADVPNILSSGADSSSRAKMYAPNPFDRSSSVSHFDITMFPNQLMEPNISTDLTHSVTPPQDLTFSLLRDIGWSVAGGPPPPAPANDNFSAAQTITGCSGNVGGTNVGATNEAGEPNHSPDNGGGTRSVWYRWQAQSTGNATITTAGSNFDTVLSVYTGSSVGALTPVAKNDDVVSGDTSSSVQFSATAGTTYMIAVDGYNNDGSGGDTGSITLNWNLANCTQTPPQLILEESGPAANQATALDSVLFLRDPFPVINTSNLFNLPADPNTRILIFVANLQLAQGEPASAVTVNLIDSNNTAYNIAALDVESVPNQTFSQVTFRLPNTLAVGTCQIKVVVHSQTSNTAVIRIKS